MTVPRSSYAQLAKALPTRPDGYWRSRLEAMDTITDDHNAALWALARIESLEHDLTETRQAFKVLAKQAFRVDQARRADGRGTEERAVTTTIQQLPDDRYWYLARPDTRCPACDHQGYRRSDVGFEHEFRCGECQISWEYGKTVLVGLERKE